MNFNWMQDKRWYGDALHGLGGYSVVMTGVYFGVSRLIMLGALCGYATFKEFYIDPTFEKNPPQSYLDGLKDFAGYFAGAVVAVLVSRI